MDNYRAEIKNEMAGKITNNSDSKQIKMKLSPIKNSSEDSPLRRALEQPPLKRFKVARTQDAGTITEPDSLGPCEPGTAINLDGIVWNETKGGLLSLNITWRGKSFMGTLMDCSTTEHGSEWASPWVNDTEAPDQKPKVSKNKKKKSKKKRKKKKNVEEHNVNPDVSLENIELEDNDEGEDSVIEPALPVQLVECKSDNCGKKFASESALKYHVSFAHERIVKKVNDNTAHLETNKIPKVEQLAVENINSLAVSSPVAETNDLKVNIRSDVINEENITRSSELQSKKTDSEKSPCKTFATTQNIRPIVPVQPPQIAGSSLKPIQPKPTILPAPAVNLCLDELKKITKKSPKLDKSPQILGNDSLPMGKPKYQNVNSYDDEPMVIDLSTNKEVVNNASNSPDKQEAIQKLTNAVNNMSTSMTQGSKTSLRDTLNASKDKEIKKESVLLKIPNPSQKSPKEKSPSIFVKTEFNTGHRKNLSDPSDQPEILKHTKSGTNIPVPPKSNMSSIFANPMGYLSHSYFSSQATVPGLMMPPLNSNPLMLPGLMNIPPSATPSSPFGSSLESLARAAEERARNFGGYSPAHIPAAFSPAHVPAAFSPAHVPAAFTPAILATSTANAARPAAPSTSDSSEVPLLRHEHMHTHLHYITSPTHSQ